MRVAIRLSRVGKKKQPSFRIVAVPYRSPRDGKSLEILGSHGASFPGQPLEINLERYDHWISVGAKPSKRVKKIVSKYRKAGGTGVLTQDGSVVEATPKEEVVPVIEEVVEETAGEETPEEPLSEEVKVEGDAADEERTEAVVAEALEVIEETAGEETPEEPLSEEVKVEGDAADEERTEAVVAEALEESPVEEVVEKTEEADQVESLVDTEESPSEEEGDSEEPETESEEKTE